MRRFLLLICMFLAVWAVGGPVLQAQEESQESAPAAEEGSAAGEAGSAEGGDSGGEPAAPSGSGWASPGMYMSVTKMLLAWIVVLMWVYSTDWVSTDAQEYKFDHLKWNPVVFAPLLVGIVAFWLIPIFFVGFPLLIISHWAPLLAYVKTRNAELADDQKVLTRKHIKAWMGRLLRKEVSMEDKDPHAAGPPITLKSTGKDERQNNVNLLSARQNPGFLEARKLIAAGLERRADAIMLDYSQQGVAVRHQIDGVWQDAEGVEREQGDPALEALKLLCGLKGEDRRSRQAGEFLIEYKKLKYGAALTSQGTSTGERAVMQFTSDRTLFKTPDDLGMRPKMQEQIKELMAAKQGFFIFSAMPGAGLRTTTHVVLRSADRFVREFMTLEEESNRYEPVENVHTTTYRKDDPEKTLNESLRRFFLQEPQVCILRDLVDGQMLGEICQEIVREGRFVISTIRAKDAAEALARLAAMKPPLRELSQSMTAVLNQRLVRKLCDDCKEAYAPPPNVLQQLGIPQGRVNAFYRPPQPPEDPREICKTCHGLGYQGRIGLFELLVVGDAVRETLATQPTVEALRAAARKDGLQGLQQEGIVLVAKGITSLAELTRVLKQ
ncbi:MAG: ATPase, T2SS/T4P/T4SS family [Thermoguttaceae bacterium]